MRHNSGGDAGGEGDPRCLQRQILGTGATELQYSGAKNVDVLANRENIEGRITCLNSSKQTFIRRAWLVVAHSCWVLAWCLGSLLRWVF